MQESRSDQDTRNFDIPDAVTVPAGIALGCTRFVNAVNAGSGPKETLLLIAGALVLMAALLVMRREQASAVMPFSIFRLPQRCAETTRSAC